MAGNDRSAALRLQLELTCRTDLNSNNSFDSNMGAGLGPAFQSEMSFDFTASAFTSVNNPVYTPQSIQTVSPKDIFNDPLGSAPPSASFTNLTTPDIGESPLLDSYDTSPMFQGDLSQTHEWYSLFPETEIKQSPPAIPNAPVMERGTSSSSIARSSPSVAGSPIVLDTSHRRKSSVNSSPAPSSGVSKSRRRKGPLPPIEVDPNDKVALKRARNTLAARDSRQRKFNHVQTLEKRVAELEAETQKWKEIALAMGFTE
jgi:hypothetical protein